ncbi:MAG: hypothetical protein IT179_08760 [Acidobacteria bacterium]|nr:hypothetical protein [Acidobacteriota bacterium]
MASPVSVGVEPALTNQKRPIAMFPLIVAIPNLVVPSVDPPSSLTWSR